MVATLLLSVLIVPPTDAEGYVPLFDGKTLAGWVGATNGYAVEDGNLVCLPEKGGNLYTADEYADFILRFEFKVPPGGNNGIGLRAPPTGDSAYEGMESQILDDSAEQYKDLKPYQAHGSIYGILPAKRGALRPAGEWNEQEITLIGRKVKVVLNGETIVEGDLDEATRSGTMDGKEHPGLKRTKGHIGLLGHGSKVEFRNLRLKDYGGS